jgi:hypothetical protein
VTRIYQVTVSPTPEAKAENQALGALKELYSISETFLIKESDLIKLLATGRVEKVQRMGELRAK